MGMVCDLLEQGVKTNSSINCAVEPYLSTLRIAARVSGLTTNGVVLASSTKLPCREMRAALLAALEVQAEEGPSVGEDPAALAKVVEEVERVVDHIALVWR